MGTAAVTTRGMGLPEMRQIAGWVADALDHADDAQGLLRIRADVEALTDRFPLYEQRLAAEPLGVV
jgi:glycine hydroxymethyltransferase